MKKSMITAILAVFAFVASYAQMTLSFSGTAVTTKTFSNGTTLVEFPLGTNLQTVMQTVSVTVGGAAVSNADIVPNPSTLSLTDDEERVFYYNGHAYQFRFSEGKYFTAVFLGDPHIGQDGHDGTSVADMQSYVARLLKMGQTDGPNYSFSALPGYVPTCDIAISLGDMDQDSEKSGSNFKSAHQGFADAGVPFITMAGNHDVVPDYWTGENPDKGLTYGFNDGGSYCNDVARGIVEDYCNTAVSRGWISDYEQIVDGTSHTQAKPFTFKFNGVRFYVGQTYWFQKPYTKPGLFSSATYYAPDGVINALSAFVNDHADEPSVWMQHYPFVWGSDCDRWWLDQNDYGLYIKTTDSSEYGTDADLGKWTDDATAQSYAKKKKDTLSEIIKRTKNAVHFSGHVHSYGDHTYNGLRDYTVAATGRNDGGLAGAYIVLMKGNKGVVEVQRIHVSETVNSGYRPSDAQLLSSSADNKANAVLARLVSGVTTLNAAENNGDLAAALTTATAARTATDVTVAVESFDEAFQAFHVAKGGANVDVTRLLGLNTDFETTQGTVLSTNANVYPQPEWMTTMTSFTNEDNKGYIHLRQRTDDGAPTAHSIYLRAKWQVYTCLEQMVKETALPTGVYQLKFRIKKAGSYTENLNFYELNGIRVLFSPTDAWTEKTVTLNVYEPSLFRLSFGFTGGVGGTESAVSVDDVTLVCTSTVSPYKKARQAAEAIDADVTRAAVSQFDWTDSELATKSAEDVDKAVAILTNAVAIAQADGDATSFIVNADFTGGYTGAASGSRVQTPNGWTFEHNYEGWNDTYVDATNKLFNAWAATIKRAELSQVIGNLPNGAYRFTADIKTDQAAAVSTIALYGNPGWPVIGRSDEAGNDVSADFQTYSCAFDVTGNSTAIGIRSDRAYYQLKNLKLEYVGQEAAEETASSYLRQDYYWDGSAVQEFDASGTKYAAARSVVVYPKVCNQLITASASDQFADTDNKIVDGTCQHLVITDGEAFATSKAFTAAAVTYNRTFTANQMSTVCLPFAPTVAAGTFYVLSADGDDVLHFNAVAAPAANTPYIFIASETSQLSATDVTIPATPAEMKSETTAGGYYMQGVQATTEGLTNVYGFSTSGTLLFAHTATMNPFRAFIQAPGAESKELKADFSDQETGVQSVSHRADNADLLWYDLQGRRVDRPLKGIYIVRPASASGSSEKGHKVVVK